MAELKSTKKKLKELEDVFGRMTSQQALAQAIRAEEFYRRIKQAGFLASAVDWKHDQIALETYALLLEKQELGEHHA